MHTQLRQAFTLTFACATAATLVACGGGSGSPTPPPLPSAPAPAPAPAPSGGACPAPVATITYSCTASTALTAMTAAQYQLLIGTYDNGGTSLANQLFVASNGNMFYGASPTAYPITSYCVNGPNAFTLYTQNNTARVSFSVSGTAVTAQGTLGGTTPGINQAPKSSCQF